MKNLGRSCIVVATLGIVAASLPFSQSAAQVPFRLAEYSATATGTVLHADAVQLGLNRLADVEVAFSGATVNSKNLNTELQNEMQRIVQPALPAPTLPGNKTYGRGSGLEAGIQLTPPSQPNDIELAALVQASSPPSTNLLENVIGPVDVDPAVYASTARGQAQATWRDDACVIGTDLSYGLGYVEDLQLIDTGGNTAGEGFDAPLVALDAPGPERAVSQSTSRTRLIPQRNQAGAIVGTDFGIVSEVRQTIAPVTLLSGTPNQITIEVAGEWVLRAHSGGLPGTAFIHYGPGDTSPSTPLIRIIDDVGTVTTILETQDLFGQTGLVVPIPGTLGEIVLGEDPRAINGSATSVAPVDPAGLFAQAAVDVARIQLLETTDAGGNVTQRVADLRVGHMEVRSAVPSGGIECPLLVEKSADPDQVQVGESFETPIVVTNTTECVMINIRVTDTITTTDFARFAILNTEPTAAFSTPGAGLSQGEVRWEGLGPLDPGESLAVVVSLQSLIDDESRVFEEGELVGRIEDLAQAFGTLADCEGDDLSGAAISVAGSNIDGTTPEVIVPVEPGIPVTGIPPLPTVLFGSGLAAVAVLSRRFFR